MALAHPVDCRSHGNDDVRYASWKGGASTGRPSSGGGPAGRGAVLLVRAAWPLGKAVPTSGGHRHPASAPCASQNLAGGGPNHPHQQQGVDLRFERTPASELQEMRPATLGDVPLRGAGQSVTAASGHSGDAGDSPGGSSSGRGLGRRHAAHDPGDAPDEGDEPRQPAMTW